MRRVILGSAAVRDPALVREALPPLSRPGRRGHRRQGTVSSPPTAGAAVSTLSAPDLAARFADAGVAAIIYTDIGRDGMLGGLNLEQTAALATASAIPVIASGGVGSLDDLRALQALQHANIEGVIVGPRPSTTAGLTRLPRWRCLTTNRSLLRLPLPTGEGRGEGPARTANAAQAKPLTQPSPGGRGLFRHISGRGGDAQC